MERHASDLAAVVHALDLGRPRVVAHSYGACVALLAAIRHPGSIRALVLAEPPAVTLFVHVPPKPSELLWLFVTQPRTATAILRFVAFGVGPATRAARRGDLETAIRAFGRAVLGRTYFRRLSPSRLEQVRANTFAAEFLSPSCFAPFEDHEVRRVGTPALLLNGEHSPAVFHRLVDRLEQLIPDTERADISAASHIVHEDNPGAFDAAVMPFLAKHDGK
jgi:pimeloyl-ACP methyl ester carboxylesterase